MLPGGQHLSSWLQISLVDLGLGLISVYITKLSPSLLVYLLMSSVCRYVDTGEMLNDFPYRARAMFAFEEQDGVDVCFFGMHVQVWSTWY